MFAFGGFSPMHEVALFFCMLECAKHSNVGSSLFKSQSANLSFCLGYLQEATGSKIKG